MRARKISKKEFAKRIGKSPRTIERWISQGLIRKRFIYRDLTGHVFIDTLALPTVFVRENLYTQIGESKGARV